LQQSLSNLLDRQFSRNIRQIGTNRLPGAVHHVARGALTIAKEKLLSSGPVTGHSGIGRRRIERLQEGHQGIHIRIR
jgi:hypothetical protein